MSIEDIILAVDSSRISINSLIVVLVLFVLCPNTVVLSNSFSAFRMQQFDLNGISYGSKSVGLNSQVKSFRSSNWIRKSVLVNLYEIININDILTKANSIIIILPTKLDFKNDAFFYELEQALIHQEIFIPVYFIVDNITNHLALQNIFEIIKRDTSSNENSAFDELIKAASVDTYFVSYNSKNALSKPLDNFDLINIQATLRGTNAEDIPTIMVVTYMDAFGLIPSLSYGCDSNGSGMAIFFELARIFKKIFSSKQLLPRYNLIFLMTSGGKFTYLGSKKWLGDHFINADNNQFGDISMVLCLDSFGNLNHDNKLYLHFARNPRNTSFPFKFIQILNQTTHAYALKYNQTLQPTEVQVVLDKPKHMAWEHEVYLTKFKNTAFTVSSYALGAGMSEQYQPTYSPSNQGEEAQDLATGPLKRAPQISSSKRDSVLDNKCEAMVPQITYTAKILADTLFKLLFLQDDYGKDTFIPFNATHDSDDDDMPIFSHYYEVSESHITNLMKLFSQYSRSQQLLTKNSVMLSNLANRFSGIMKEIKIQPFRADKRDPEFQFYDNFEGTLTFYRSKPAIFDLYLAFVIATYLGLLYLIMTYFTVLSNSWITFTLYIQNAAVSGMRDMGLLSRNESHQNNSTYYGSSKRKGVIPPQSPSSDFTSTTVSSKNQTRTDPSNHNTVGDGNKYDRSESTSSKDNFMSHFYHNNIFRRNGYI